MKAVLITKQNIDSLASRFGIDNLDIKDLMSIGCFLVTDFGNDETFDVVTKTKFVTQFDSTGVKLDNEFFEVNRR